MLMKGTSAALAQPLPGSCKTQRKCSGHTKAPVSSLINRKHVLFNYVYTIAVPGKLASLTIVKVLRVLSTRSTPYLYPTGVC